MNLRKLRIALLASATALMPIPAVAMPQAIGALVLPFITSSSIFFLGPAAISAVSMGIGYAVTAAALLGVQTLLSPKTDVPKPEDGKYNLKQAVPSLAYVLGEVRKGGDYVFLEERGGTAYHITVFAAHRIKGFKEHWLHDGVVTLDGSGVISEPYYLNGTSNVRLDVRRGTTTQTAFGAVVSTFPEIWTEDHRGIGLAAVLMRCRTVSQKNYQKVYPNQMPQHTATIEGNDQIYDPRTKTSGYTTNLALHRLWHLTHSVGGKLTRSDMYLPEWSHAADVADQIVLDREGAEVRRYHGGFWFRANNDPVEIGRIMDQAGEMVVYERPDGLVGVHAGEFVVPDVRLTGDDIIALSFDANRRRSSNVLAVKGQYTSKDAGFTTVDAAPYGNAYGLEDSTERVRTIQNQAVQHHNHMARLEKVTYIRANAPRVTLVAHYEAARHARTKRFIRVHRPPRLDEAIIELTESPKLSLRNLTIEFTGIVVPPSLYAFDPATDEGAPGSPVIPVAPQGVPAPVGFDVTILNEIISGGGMAAFALATWDALDDSFLYELEWEPVGGGTTQSAFSLGDGETEMRSGHLADGGQFRFRLRAWSGGQSSAWTEEVVRVAIADPEPPGAALSVSATGGTDNLTFFWTAPNSSNYFAALLYLGEDNSITSATLVSTEYGSANDVETVTIPGIPAGTFFGWVVAINASGVRAAAVPTGPITVT